MNKTRSNMLHRRFYNYSLGDFLYNMYFYCKCCSKDKDKPYSLHNRYRLLEKGLDKFTKEFDSEYYAKSLRHLQMLVASLMDDNERYLSFYQRHNTISLLKSDTEEESDRELHKDMPGLIDKKSKSKHYAAVDKFLNKYFAENHSSKDYKLMNGVLTNKALSNKVLDDIDGDPSQEHLESYEKSEEKIGINEMINHLNESSNHKLDSISNYYQHSDKVWDPTETRDKDFNKPKKL